MKERTKFILEWERRRDLQMGRCDVAELCRVFGVSRPTGYRWIKRYLDGGGDITVLGDRSSRPQSSPSAIPEETQDAIVRARKDHPRWGPRKLRAWLVRRYPGCDVPAASTIGDILKRRGMTTPRRGRSRRHAPAPSAPFAEAKAPNSIWCMDFKGKFRTRNGAWCTPFTVTDAFSRYCIRCEIVEEATDLQVEYVLDSAFREFGLPAAIRSDNGPPFAAQGPLGLTRLAVWLLRMGIRLERIQPGKPQQNGRHERYHLTLMEVVVPPQANAVAQQRVFDLHRREYNEERPHEALGLEPPARVYFPSSRRYPGARVTLQTRAFGHVERVRNDGTLLWHRRRVFISNALAGELVEFAPDFGPAWTVFFGDLVIGTLDAQSPDRLLAVPRPRKQHSLQLCNGGPRTDV